MPRSDRDPSIYPPFETPSPCCGARKISIGERRYGLEVTSWEFECRRCGRRVSIDATGETFMERERISRLLFCSRPY